MDAKLKAVLVAAGRELQDIAWGPGAVTPESMHAAELLEQIGKHYPEVMLELDPEFLAG